MTTFQRSAKLMADRLRILKRLQTQAKEEGRDHLEIHVDALWDSKDQEALDAYEEELLEHSGAQRLPGLEVVG